MTRTARLSGSRFYTCLSWLAFHFFLVLSICARDAFWALGHSDTIFPKSLASDWEKGRKITAVGLGETFSKWNPVRQSIAVYTYSTGIDVSYGFFAPSVPNSYKLVFEIHYPNGDVDYELPRVAGSSAGMRLATLFAHIARTDYEPLRELIFQMLCYSVWVEHPDATKIRSVFGYIKEPRLSQVGKESTETYHALYSYDFSFPEKAPPATP